jgi:3' terminal RNA ribose 2'-O-methyltransferase Hen1
MLLTITTTHSPATDLGFLLFKNPANVQSFELNFGSAHVFYPEATPDRCTAALLLDIDPVGLVRTKGRTPSTVEQYVNDRPYVASSFLSVAVAEVYGSALNGKSRERAELVSTPIPLEIVLWAVQSRGGEALLRRLFEPLGYNMKVETQPLDTKFPHWGDSNYFKVTLIYVLIPVLDNAKHYSIGEDEVDKLLKRGEGWLANHPERNFITNRYLRHRRRLTRRAFEELDRLIEEEQPDVDEVEAAHGAEEAQLEERISLNQMRMNTVVAALKSAGATSVVDLGCGEGTLLRRLLDDKVFTKVTGVDVSFRSLEIAKQKLRMDDMPERQRERVQLVHGSLTYRDARLRGYDAATCIEVIEHLDPYRLNAFERVVFEFAQPPVVIMTTPNIEYNAKFPTLPAGQLRHKDHRFEWTRDEFRQWAEGAAERHGYKVRFLPIGDDDPQLGPPTQMGVFTR